MRTVQSVYDNYNLMQNLQDHQLRVAAVAKVICTSLTKPVDTDLVVTGCLLHDMGNIIKFDLSYFPEFLEPQGLKYWTEEKERWIAKYGPSEHNATKEITIELGASQKLLDLMEAGGFSRLETVEKDLSHEKKIFAYADMRVGPHGIISLDERMTDGRKRYADRKDKAIASERYEKLVTALRSIEDQIFSASTLQPEEITDEAAAETLQELRMYSLHL